MALAVPHIRLSVSVKHCPKNGASDEVRILASKDISAHDKQGDAETYERWVKADPCETQMCRHIVECLRPFIDPPPKFLRIHFFIGVMGHSQVDAPFDRLKKIHLSGKNIGRVPTLASNSASLPIKM